ncbi:HopJ type III effector protein [Methylomonas sp. AM2-LC]|uniref:HopJ type III effector protein n=1 Tax=Methylomonas sp. AM2-LC TaxID=3153301 RepID=UPI0032631B1E
MLNSFLQRIKSNQDIDFKETMDIIAQYYYYQPTRFTNGITQVICNEAGSNEGSCRLFAFAKIHNLTQQQTLALFGDYYRKDVLEHPDGSDHANIRQFICDGWQGIQFAGEVLLAK